MAGLGERSVEVRALMWNKGNRKRERRES